MLLDCLENIINHFGTDMNLVVDNTLEFDQLFKEETPRVIKLDFDPLALSCVNYRLHQLGRGQYHDLATVGEPLPEDQRRAQEIRAYYGAKFTWQTLKEGKISAFRREAQAVMAGALITNKNIGLLYRLPFFYMEDIDQEAVFAGLPEYECSTILPATAGRFTLDRKVSVFRSKSEYIRYWLRAEGVLAPCAIAVEHRNTLKSLLDSMFERGPVNLIANWHSKNLWQTSTPRQYYQLAYLRVA